MSLKTLKFLGQPLHSWMVEDIKKVIIFLHGSGDTGPGVSQWLESLGVKNLVDKNTAVVFPRNCSLIVSQTKTKKSLSLIFQNLKVHLSEVN